jgi:hypothetical protein
MSQRGHSNWSYRPQAGDRTMTIELAAVSIGIVLIVWGTLIWKKLRVVEGRLALMQDELALMQNGIKELQIIESRLFNVFMLNADAFKKATDVGLSTSAPAAPIDAGGQAAPVAVTQTTKMGLVR